MQLFLLMRLFRNKKGIVFPMRGGPNLAGLLSTQASLLKHYRPSHDIKERLFTYTNWAETISVFGTRFIFWDVRGMIFFFSIIYINQVVENVYDKIKM